jgi:hypothetical protein
MANCEIPGNIGMGSTKMLYNRDLQCGILCRGSTN